MTKFSSQITQDIANENGIKGSDTQASLTYAPNNHVLFFNKRSLFSNASISYVTLCLHIRSNSLVILRQPFKLSISFLQFPGIVTCIY